MNMPVETVSWDDCQEFIKKLGKKDKMQYRLPTEAEWEYSCRAGSKGAYFYGDDSKQFGQYGWFSENSGNKKYSGNKTQPGGQKKPNAWGLYDMHGNVWEWCQDWYGVYPQKDVIDPQGPDVGEERVLRGGAFLGAASGVRSAIRRPLVPWYRHLLNGFRLAMTFSP